MTDRSLELALRMKADFDEASKEVAQLDAQLDQLGSTGKQTAAEVKASGQAIDQAGAASAAAATKHDANAAATRREGDAAGAASVKERQLAQAAKAAGDASAGAAGKHAQSGKALAQVGVSAAQTQAAMRQLPAQITDIVTGLASGQSPFMVAIQQGGQLKDSFGGIAPAARAVAGAISPMVIAVTAGTAAVGLMGLAMVQAYQEIQAYERALISSGNVAGTTAGQLANIADQVGAASGRFGDAEKATTALAASGKIAGDVLDEAANAAVNLSILTGDAIETTTDKIIKLASAPTETLLELNRQYNFLTVEVYEHVRALEDQGRAEDAARAAVEAFADVHEQRVQEALERAGALERGWMSLKKTIASVWQSIKDIGRDDAEARLATARSTLANLREGSVQARGLSTPLQIRQQEQLVKSLEAEVAAAQKAAKAQGDRQAAQTAGVAASRDVNKLLDEGASKAEKLGKATGELKRQFLDLRKAAAADGKPSDLLAGVTFGADGSISGGAYDQALKTLQDRFKEPKGPKPKKPATPKKTDAERSEETAQRELENLREQIALLDTLEEGETSVSNAARVRYEIESGAYKQASANTKAALEASAQELDTERQRMEVAKQLVDVKLRTMQLQGRGDEASLKKTLDELERLRRKAIELKDAAATANIARLMELEKANSQLQQLQRGFSTFAASISAAEQRINIERENGLITSVEAQERLLELRQKEIEFLQQQIPLLEESAAAYGDQVPPELLQRIDQFKNQLYDLQTQGSLLQTTFRNTFETGLADALYGLATGTKSLREAVTGFITDMIAGMARLAAQQLASLATTKLMAALFKQTSSTDVGQGAGKLQTAAVLTAGAGLVINTGAKALSQSAQELTAAATLLLVANAIGGYAEGGYTGPGGKYQVAGYVHKGEGVLNQREIGAIGGPDGFFALRRAIAAGEVNYGDAGTAYAAPSPRYAFAEGGFASGAMPAPTVELHNHNVFDIESVARRLVSTEAFRKETVNVVADSGDELRGRWG